MWRHTASSSTTPPPQHPHPPSKSEEGGGITRDQRDGKDLLHSEPEGLNKMENFRTSLRIEGTKLKKSCLPLSGRCRRRRWRSQTRHQGSSSTWLSTSVLEEASRRGTRRANFGSMKRCQYRKQERPTQPPFNPLLPRWTSQGFKTRLMMWVGG